MTCKKSTVNSKLWFKTFAVFRSVQSDLIQVFKKFLLCPMRVI